jgi:hypothetical protein
MFVLTAPLAISGGLDVQGALQCDSFRIDQTPATGTITPDKYIVINCNGTDYRIAVKAGS